MEITPGQVQWNKWGLHNTIFLPSCLDFSETCAKDIHPGSCPHSLLFLCCSCCHYYCKQKLSRTIASSNFFFKSLFIFKVGGRFRSKIYKLIHSKGPIPVAMVTDYYKVTWTSPLTWREFKGQPCLCCDSFDNFLYNLTVICVSGHCLTLKSGKNWEAACTSVSQGPPKWHF